MPSVGAWGARTFENDDASDWVYELEGADDDAVLRGPLAAAAADELDAPEASCPLAAVEVVAAAAGASAHDLPPEVTAWVGAHAVSDDLRALARQAVERVAARSELRELWDEAGDPDWFAAVGDLQSRLSG